MEYLKKDELYKNRGYANCISCGYHTMFDNYKNILSYTWKSALAYLIVNFIALSITNGFTIPTDLLNWVIWSVMLVASLSSQIYLFAHIVNVFTDQGKLIVFKKLIIMFLCQVLVAFLSLVFIYVTIIFAYQSQYGSNITMAVVALLVILLLIFGIPFYYISIKYVAEDEQNFVTVVRANYYKGLSHLGLIFLTSILSMLFVGVASIIIALPLYLLMIAKLASETGMLFGDAAGMPAYFPYLYSLTAAVTAVILMYFKTFVFSTLYYTYGSIEQRENERIGFMEHSMGI